MATDSPWPTIHVERAALADDLDNLSEAQWKTPSLCAPWTAHEVLGHMTATATMTPPKFFLKLASSGFRFDAMSAREVAAQTARAPEKTLAEFRANVNATMSPPGPVTSWLGETIVHAEDIRRPLDITHAYPIEALVRLAEFYKRSNTLIGAKRRIEGLTLRGTDADWSTGTGPEVSGTMLSLVMAMTGRPGVFSDLSGDGVPDLSARLGRP